MRWGARYAGVVAGAMAAWLAGCGEGGTRTAPVADGALRDALFATDAGPVAGDARPVGGDGGPSVPDAGPPDAAPDASPIAPDASPPDAASPPDGASPDAAPPDAAPSVPDGGPPTAASCFDDAFENPSPIGPDYDQFQPVVGRHCRGTNHQDIRDVERVVFLGDSVTVGTPPTPAPQFYRSLLAERLAARFRLPPPAALWKEVNLIDGTALVPDDGTYASCARYGARTDDFLEDGDMILRCFPEAERHRRTLVVITMGGNDVSSITRAGIEGRPLDEIWQQTREFVEKMRDAIRWFREPGRFPNGVFVVFANMFEFTDGTGDVQACPAAGLAGFGAAWEDPQALADMVIWANEQFLSIAVETGSDMIFMLESFCGHGFNADDPSAPCYRGPGTETWFDLTCIHPNPTGHVAIADLFLSVIED